MTREFHGDASSSSSSNDGLPSSSPSPGEDVSGSGVRSSGVVIVPPGDNRGADASDPAAAAGATQAKGQQHTGGAEGSLPPLPGEDVGSSGGGGILPGDIRTPFSEPAFGVGASKKSEGEQTMRAEREGGGGRGGKERGEGTGVKNEATVAVGAGEEVEDRREAESAASGAAGGEEAVAGS